VQVAVSDAGTLASMAGPVVASAGALQLAIFNRDGSSEPLSVPLGPYNHPRVSPDGLNVAVVTDTGKEQQVWIYGLSKISAARRLTFGGSNQYPEWSADGTRVAFQSTRDGHAGIWWQRADGTDTATPLTTAAADIAHIAQSFSPDGRHFLYDEVRSGAVTLWDRSMADGKAKPVPIPPSDVVNDGTFSPDGRWFAYAIRPQDPAQSIVFVEPYPPTGARYQLSRQGEDGHHAAWSRDGKLLYYTPGPGNRFIALPITMSPTFGVGDPINIERPFVNAPPASSRTYDTTRDGRILGLRMDIGPDGRPMSPQVHVVLNWFEELKQRVPVK
jgi:Tol biopolymer transport system component